MDLLKKELFLWGPIRREIYDQQLATPIVPDKIWNTETVKLPVIHLNGMWILMGLLDWKLLWTFKVQKRFLPMHWGKISSSLKYWSHFCFWIHRPRNLQYFQEAIVKPLFQYHKSSQMMQKLRPSRRLPPLPPIQFMHQDLSTSSSPSLPMLESNSCLE